MCRAYSHLNSFRLRFKGAGDRSNYQDGAERADSFDNYRVDTGQLPVSTSLTGC
jgi:hypothetical protein